MTYNPKFLESETNHEGGKWCYVMRKHCDNATVFVYNGQCLPCQEELKCEEANLISAAPDLYHSLKAADQVICNLCKKLNPQHKSQDNGKGCFSCFEREEILHAIHKAEGKC